MARSAAREPLLGATGEEGGVGQGRHEEEDELEREEDDGAGVTLSHTARRVNALPSVAF